MLQQLLCQPQHAQQALQLLHLLVQSVSLCQVLHAGLDEGFQLEGGTSPSLRPGAVQEDAAGHSASSPVDIDADNDDIKDHPTRCCSTLFTTACSCLEHVLQTSFMQSLSALCGLHHYAYSCNHVACDNPRLAEDHTPFSFRSC